jgi:hypothetical protein
LAGPSDPTIKRLFAVSSNRCAFPSCSELLVEGGTVVGEVCHIKSARKGHPRYDPDQAEEERHGFDNLILLCRKHHKIIDTEVERYPPTLLTEMKRAHEAHPEGRFTISNEMVQRLGELLSAPPVTTSAPGSQAGASSSYPDWTIRELFFHIRPDLIDQADEKRWASVGREVIDHFSTGRLKVWGRPRRGTGRRGPMKLVNEPGYWTHAEFSYWFLKEDGQESNHTWVKTETGLPDYSDLQVNRTEALAIWPSPGVTQDDRTEIMLLDAARRAYSETRNDPAAAHAEMSNATPDEILKWYCVWLAQHMQLYGARRPSTKIEPVTIDNPTKDFDLKDSSLTLRERYGSAVWENLRVKFDELPAVIRDLKGYGR